MTARYPREQVDAVLRTVHTGTVHRIVLRMGLTNPLALRSGGGECFAIFERSVGKLAVVRTQALMGHPDLPALLREHRIALER